MAVSTRCGVNRVSGGKDSISRDAQNICAQKNVKLVKRSQSFKLQFHGAFNSHTCMRIEAILTVFSLCSREFFVSTHHVQKSCQLGNGHCGVQLQVATN